MKPSWFCVTCKVDNGCCIEIWESIVYATTALQAGIIAETDWNTRDSETFATVQSIRKLSETEIYSKRVRSIA